MMERFIYPGKKQENLPGFFRTYEFEGVGEISKELNCYLLKCSKREEVGRSLLALAF